MSMSATLSNALSGLSAVQRSAQVVSANIANALTEGYGRREVSLSAASLGGVQVNGIVRVVDPAVLFDRRIADAGLERDSARTGFLDRFATLLGSADSSNSLTGRLATLEGRLIEAASRPDSTTRLEGVAAAARSLANLINQAGQGIQAERQAADAAIARDVETLNTTLAQVAKLNADIARNAGKTDMNPLLDQRQQLIDRIAQIVPIRQIPRDRDVVALVTTGGQVLLDSRVATIEFTPANAVTPGMSLAGGQLSGLTIDGRAVTPGGDGRMDGGRLEGLFVTRDSSGPEAQAQLDAFARDLIQRFEDPSVDTTRAPGAPGLFTDSGNALTVSPTEGLAQRLSLNALADPEQGGAVWRLRDGLGAATSGAVGQAGMLHALTDALNAPRATALGGAQSAATFASEFMAQVNGSLFRADESQTFAQSRADTLRQQEFMGGVDMDQEMQTLLLIEQNYGANARVIQAVDEMMRRLLEI